MRCKCPDNAHTKRPCKPIFAALAYIRARYNGDVNVGAHKDVELVKNNPRPKGDYGKKLDRQSTITRLAVLNTATEILKSQQQPVSFDEVVALAGRLEVWALGD
jgi:hypothetical protein